MKHILTFFLLSFATLTQAQTKSLTAPLDRSFTTNYHFTSTHHYYSPFNSTTYLNRENIFNSEGQREREIIYGSSGSINGIWDREYYPDGKLRYSRFKNSSEEILNTSEYIYNEQGKTDQYIWHAGDKDSVIRTTFYAYNDNGYYTQATVVASNGDTTRITKRAYDDQNRMLFSYVDLGGNDTFDYTYDYSYSGSTQTEVYVKLDDTAANQMYKRYYNEFGDHVKTEKRSKTTGKYYLEYTYDLNYNGSTDTFRRYQEDSTVFYSYAYDYNSYLTCPTLFPGKIHKLYITIPEDGLWQFSTCGSSINTVLTLDSTSYCDSSLMYAMSGCGDGRAEFALPLLAGKYYLTVGGKTEADTGIYDLAITKTGVLNTRKVSKENVYFYPQPAQNQITFEAANSAITSIELLSITGKRMCFAPYSKTFDLSPYSNGIYVLRLWNERELVGSNKVIISK